MSEWIDVDKRLPQRDRSVAVLITDPNVAIFNWPTCAYMRVDFAGMKDERIVWWAGVPGNYDSLPSWTVTHWMPLPDPPKEGE